MDWKAVLLSIRTLFAPMETVAAIGLTLMVVAFTALMLHFHRAGAQPISVDANNPGLAPSASGSATPGAVAQPATLAQPTPSAQVAVVASARPRTTARPTTRPTATPAPSSILPTVTALPTDSASPPVVPTATPTPPPSP